MKGHTSENKFLFFFQILKNFSNIHGNTHKNHNINVYLHELKKGRKFGSLLEELGLDYGFNAISLSVVRSIVKTHR